MKRWRFGTGILGSRYVRRRCLGGHAYQGRYGLVQWSVSPIEAIPSADAGVPGWLPSVTRPPVGLLPG